MRFLLSLCFVLLSNGVFAQAPAMRATAASNPVLGTWRLVSAGNIYKDGRFEPFAEYGPNPIGYLMYDATGHMCVSLANPKHPHWADADRPTDAEKAESFRVMFAYCGTYEVQEKVHRIIHRPEMSSWPHYVGTDQVRPYQLEGKRLILSGHETAPGDEPSDYKITWERVEK
jgi:hypothetical protein